MPSQPDEVKPLISIEHITETNDPIVTALITDNEPKSIQNCSGASNNILVDKELLVAETDRIISDTSSIRKLDKIDMTKPEQIDEDLNLKMTEAIVKNMDAFLSYVKNKKDNMKSDGLVECGIWDYAGPRDYYATHQTFLTSKAIYLLVVDITDGITTFQDDTEFSFESIGRYIDFWLDSIHFHRDITAEGLRPPVIMVCTGIDKVGKNREKKKKRDEAEKEVNEKQKRVLPEAINQLSEGDKTRNSKLMQSSKTEKRYFVKTMIVGKESTGKTCLLRRLLKDNISDVTSTDGIDIVVRRCKINIEDGKWIIGKEIDDDKVSRIKRALNPNAQDRDTQNMQVDETKTINKDQRDEMSTFKNGTTSDALVSRDKSGDTNESSLLVMPEDFTTDAKVSLDTYKEKKASSSLVMPGDLMSHVFSKSTVNTSSNLYALCQLWDFAGQ
ncbi:unnamed protein product [Mytilus coruscus]|uniref:Roc domain-containing protein n=1 Tax=Mytilus coruscus TaxID=42192 RepID=A0A6J8E7G6_MYTCO|nr:unnamed protein product [Mytilus coruscus]